MGDGDPSAHMSKKMNTATDPHPDLTKSTIELLGLTLLATGGPNPALDVIFVHGLQGHPEHTWTYIADTKSKASKFWRFSQQLRENSKPFQSARYGSKGSKQYLGYFTRSEKLEAKVWEEG